MSGSENRKSSRPSVRHDYGQVNEKGFGDDGTGNLSENSDSQEGATVFSPVRNKKDETLALLQSQLHSLDQEEEELRKDAEITKLQKRIQQKKKSVADLRESTDEIGIASDQKSNPIVEDTTAESTYAIGIASDARSNPIVEDTTAETTDEIGIASDMWSNSALEETTTGAKEIKRKLKEYGDENVVEIVRSSVDEWRSTPLHICVTGSSGNGKSFLINVLRDVKDEKDKLFAKTGTTETTYECKPYPHPNYDNIIFWDVPGVGSARFQKETYLSDIKFDRYDFFLLCSSTRFKEHDLWLADEIKKRYKRFYFLRTKVDQEIYSACHEKGIKFNSKNELAKIRKDCKSYLPDNVPCFLISSYVPTMYDFPLLLKQLVEDAPSEQKHALILGLCLSSKEAIERKAKALEGEIWKTAFLSSLGDAIPGVSVAIDVALICSTVKSYRETFKLTDEEINTFAANTGVTPDSFKEAAGLMLRPDMFTQDGIASLIRMEPAVEKSAIVVPLISYAVAGKSSYIVTGRILNKLLKTCKDDALKVFDFVAERLDSE